jgi:hypothetical protein
VGALATIKCLGLVTPCLVDRLGLELGIRVVRKPFTVVDVAATSERSQGSGWAGRRGRCRLNRARCTGVPALLLLRDVDLRHACSQINLSFPWCERRRLGRMGEGSRVKDSLRNGNRIPGIAVGLNREDGRGDARGQPLNNNTVVLRSYRARGCVGGVAERGNLISGGRGSLRHVVQGVHAMLLIAHRLIYEETVHGLEGAMHVLKVVGGSGSPWDLLVMMQPLQMCFTLWHSRLGTRGVCHVIDVGEVRRGIL